VQLDQIRLGNPPAVVHRFTDVGRIDRSPDGTEVFSPIVRVSPDGLLVRIGVTFLDRGRIGSSPPTEESVWIVQSAEANGVMPGLVRVIPRRSRANADCQTEAWVASTTYGRMCMETVEGRRVPIVHLETLDGRRTDVQVGDSIGFEDLEWLVDGTAGIVYRWSAFGHVIGRLDVATGAVTRRNVLGPDPAWASPDSPRPAALSGRAAWQQLESAASVAPVRLAGSIDGSLLLAVGKARTSDASEPGSPPASTGVYAFDAATLGLVARWPAAAMADQVGVSPDGRFVLTVGLAGVTADGIPAEWPPSLAIQDAIDGHLVEQVSRAGGDPEPFVGLLPPGPVP